MIRVTIAVPEAHVGDANQLALCLGSGPADGQTWGPARYRDAGGARYSLASAVVAEGFVVAAAAPLIEPEWGADMAAAVAAQALLAVFDLSGVAAGGPPDMAAAPGRITAVVSDDPAAALAVLGLAPVPEAG